jgi:sulfur carrier protein
VTVTVNGQTREVARGTTLEALVRDVTEATTGIAVAVDEDVVSRRAWSDVRLHEGARVEILTAMQGG